MSLQILDTPIEVMQFKYKPREWENVLGNPHIVACLSRKTISDMENYAFLGPEGIGKGVCASLLGKHVFNGLWKEWNMSAEGNMATVKDQVIKFCKDGDLAFGKRKLAIFQEADNIGFKAQQALREPMEKYKKRVVFIITANYEGKILPPIMSRCCPMRFALIPKKEIEELTLKILNNEKIAYTHKQFEEVVYQANGRARNVCSLLGGWTAAGVLYIESRLPLVKKLKSIFPLLAKREIDPALDIIQDALSITTDRTIVSEMTNIIRDHKKMPWDFKAKSLVITGQTYADIVGGVDPHTALFSMTSKMMLNLKIPKKDK